MIPPKYWSPTKKLMVLGAMAGGKLVEDTATGNPLTFITDVSKPLKSLLIPFTPQQEGTGDPSPSNIRSILPWNGLTVFGGGKNLLDDSKKAIYGDTLYIGTTKVGAQNNRSVYLKAGTYTLSVETYDGTNSNLYVQEEASTVLVRALNTKTATFTVDHGAWFIIWVYKTDYSEIGTGAIVSAMLNTGDTAAFYETPHITKTDIPFASPVYGGTLDVVSGVLTVEYAEIVFKGTEKWVSSESDTSVVTPVPALKNNTAKQSIICDLFKYSLDDLRYLNNGEFTDSITSTYNIRLKKPNSEMTVQEFKSLLASNNMHIVYKLETPQEITLTPEQIIALKGNNTIWSDADGSMTAVYLKKG